MALRVMFKIHATVDMDTRTVSYVLDVEDYETTSELYKDCDYAIGIVTVYKHGQLIGSYKSPIATVRYIEDGNGIKFLDQLRHLPDLINIACFKAYKENKEMYQSVNDFSFVMLGGFRHCLDYDMQRLKVLAKEGIDYRNEQLNRIKYFA